METPETDAMWEKDVRQSKGQPLVTGRIQRRVSVMLALIVAGRRRTLAAGRVTGFSRRRIRADVYHLKSLFYYRRYKQWQADKRTRTISE
jgi:hypothetical protein